MTQEETATAIADFIRRHGVNRCPTACVLPTQGRVSAADRARLEQYWIARELRREQGRRKEVAAAQ